MREWISMAELKQATLPGLPRSFWSLHDFVRHVRAKHPHAVRTNGRRLEILVNALPDVARAAIAFEVESRAAARPTTLIGLSAHQRAVFNARHLVLAEIDCIAATECLGVSAAVEKFISRNNAGELPLRVAAAVHTAVGRGNSVSRSTLFSWIALRQENSIASLAPCITRRKSQPPKWLLGFITVRSNARSIADAYRRWDGGFGAGEKPSYAAVRRAIRKALTPDGFNALKASLPAGALPSYTKVRRILTGQ